MRRLRAVLVAASGALGACAAPLESTLTPPVAPGVVAVGASATVWPADRADAEFARFRAELQARVVRGDFAVPVQMIAAPDKTLRVRLGLDESFAPGSAQLLPTALATYAELAAAVAARPGVVTHVLVHGDATGIDPSVDLTVRRAASIVHYLTGRGLAAGRLRGEGRGTSEPVTLIREDRGQNPRVELVFKPVIAGREAEAWVPPEPLPPCAACSEE